MEVVQRDVAKPDDVELVRGSVSIDFDSRDADLWLLRAVLFGVPAGSRQPLSPTEDSAPSEPTPYGSEPGSLDQQLHPPASQP